MLPSDVELRDLRRLVREFLKEIHYVPFRSVDCDPALVGVLRKKLINASKFRTYIATPSHDIGSTNELSRGTR